ncbi:methylated-DNA--[protein]-cysteine S-methyltransferase [Streptomyces sp. LHD-70]|uniref:methylated-DNA--[protein]-cysteine S-methyltransferase n=1 Tax=Streptomyces sp. LHD-70 TaxID=3072140 RepID=UPI00280CAA1C|nr:methylated-DNA--[protein]-cysteine S-methyltransferase [Streptomyces sp. LHD-70]MDQ8706883.1 methylated-DNA--[protein]-cysteine S-methyltransferase [Streptomyces sp. LHD-70]
MTPKPPKPPKPAMTPTHPLPSQSGRHPATAAVRVHPSPIGTLALAATQEALVLCAFTDAEGAGRRLAKAGLRPVDDGSATPAQRRLLDAARDQLDGYLAGSRREFTVPVDLRLATPFSRETVGSLDALVPYGRTTTYGALATALGRPGAARAVGTALGANPLCVLLPCHRVVAGSGRDSGYAGGIEAKRTLLALEAAAA